MYTCSAKDYAIAQQLDEYVATLSAIDLLNRTVSMAHRRLDAHLSMICDFFHDEDRQDTALTELESRVLDLERQHADLWQALAAVASRVEEIARCIARSNLRCQ